MNLRTQSAPSSVSGRRRDLRPVASLVLVGVALAGLLLPQVTFAQPNPRLVLVRIAISRPGDVTLVDKLGIVALAHLATKEEEYLLAIITPDDVVRLRDAGLAVHIADEDARSALYYVVQSESVETVKRAARELSVVYDDGLHAIGRLPVDRSLRLSPDLSIPVVRLGPDPVVLAPPATGDVPANPPYDPLVEDLVTRITTDALRAHVGGLSGEWPVSVGGSAYTLRTRYSYSGEPLSKATQYVYEYMQALGYEASYHTFVLSNQTLRNVIGEKLGTRYPDRIAMLTAHLDSRAADPPHDPAPGADDNASGSAALLAIADLIADLEFEYTVRLAFFTGEEQGMYGSDAYAQLALDRGDDILGVINLDMIAWDAKGGPEVDLHSNAPSVEDDSDALADLFAAIIDTYDINLSAQIVEAGATFSDHYRFWQRGYPAIMAIEDYYNPSESPGEPRDWNVYYHTVNDRLDTLNLIYFREYARAALGTLAHLARPTRVISGTVTAAATGSPLAANCLASGTTGSYQAATAEDGTYSLHVPSGIYTVTASSYGYQTGIAVGVDAMAGPGAVVDFALSELPTFTVSGTLSEADAGQPITGTVTFGDGPAIAAPAGRYSATVPGGTYDTVARAPFHYPSMRTVTVDQDLRIDFAVTRTPCLLVVDDDHDNEGTSYSDEVFYTAALDDLSVGYDLWPVPDDADGPPIETLRLYRGIVWLTGRDWDFTLTPADQAALSQYLDSGGRLFVSGQDIGWDLANDGSPPPFYTSYLHAEYLVDDSESSQLAGSGWMSGIDITIQGGDGADNQEWPSEIGPLGGATDIFHYPDGVSGAVAYADDNYRAVYFAFGFEAINSGADRREVMSRVLGYLDPCLGEPASHVVSGTLFDASTAQPISGTVRFGDDLVVQAPSGHYSTTLAAGTYDVEVRSPFHVPVTRTVVVDRDQRQHFTLTATPCLLVVDDDYDDEGNPYEDQAYYTAALDDLRVGYDLWAVPDDADGPPANALSLYRGVVWLTGRDWDLTLKAGDQVALAQYLDGGGRLFVSGQDIGWELAREAPVAPFYTDYLHASYLLDDSGYRELAGSGWMTGVEFSIAGGDGADNQEWPSAINTAGDGVGILYYPGETANWGAVSYAGDVYRVVYFAFGFEAIDSGVGRRETMRRVLEYLAPCEVPAVEPIVFLPLVLRE